MVYNDCLVRFRFDRWDRTDPKMFDWITPMWSTHHTLECWMYWRPPKPNHNLHDRQIGIELIQKRAELLSAIWYMQPNNPSRTRKGKSQLLKFMFQCVRSFGRPNVSSSCILNRVWLLCAPSSYRYCYTISIFNSIFTSHRLIFLHSNFYYLLITVQTNERTKT